MRPADYPELAKLISEPRLSNYVARYSGNVEMALQQYTWNLAASAALWGPIGVMEVVLRNALHFQMVDSVGTEKWWDSDRVHLLDGERTKLSEALRKLTQDGNSNPSADDVVAATSLAFWVGLLTHGVARDPRYSYHQRMWEPRLRRAFPYRGRLERREIWGMANDVRKVRNRIAHHEPIWYMQVVLVLGKVEQILGAIHPEAASFVSECERVRDLERRRGDFFADHGECRF